MTNVTQKLKYDLGRVENIDNMLPVYEHDFTLNTLPTNKILDESKFKAFADDKKNATQKLKLDIGRVENIV